MTYKRPRQEYYHDLQDSKASISPQRLLSLFLVEIMGEDSQTFARIYS